jgi:hybrid cluster-associated redox disulfide protein
LRWRKDVQAHFDYYPTMNESNSSSEIEPGLLVSEILARWPQTIPVFVKYRMNCVGCEMSIFEALGDAARIYGLDSEQFCSELRQAANHSASPGPKNSER